MDISEILRARALARGGAAVAAAAEARSPVAGGALPATRVPAYISARAARRGGQPEDEWCMAEETRRKARERLRFVRMVEAAARDMRTGVRQAAEWVAAHRAEWFPELATAGKHGTSALRYANYRNWASLARGGGGDAAAILRLADSYATGARGVKGPDIFWESLRAAWLSLNRLPVTVAYDVACKRTRQALPDAELPTVHQARRHLDSIRRDLVILAREGEVAHRNSCVDYITRDWAAIRPGQMIVGDNRTFDTRVRMWDEAGRRWIAVRPTICALMDAASWHVAAWAVTPCAPNAEIIINTLAQYCAQAGAPPAHAYFDNGRDFCARGFSTPLVTSDGSCHSIFRELGIGLTNSIAYNARAKTVEMFFHELMNRFDRMFADYLGSRPGERSQAADWFDRHPEQLPSLQEFTERLQAFLDEADAKPKHGMIHQGRSPAEIWAGRRPAERRMDPAALRMAFARPMGEYTVGRGPAVAVRRRRFVCDELEFGERVLVKADPLDQDTVHCFTLKGAYIGPATAREPVAAMAADPEERDALRDAIRRQYRQLREARTALRDATGGLHVLSPGELLQTPPDGCALVRMGAIASVKGAAHTYTRYIPAAAEASPQGAAEGADAPREPREPPADPQLAALISQARHQFEAQEQEAPRTPLPQPDTLCMDEDAPPDTALNALADFRAGFASDDPDDI